MFANVIASTDQLKLTDDFIDVVFMAMAEDESDEVWHRSLVILGEVSDRGELIKQMRQVTR